MRIEVGNRAVGRRHDRIRRFAMLVPLQTTDVQAFVKLIAIAADTTKGAGGPRFADCSHKKVFFAAFFEKRVIRGWELKWLGGRGESEEEEAKAEGGSESRLQAVGHGIAQHARMI